MKRFLLPATLVSAAASLALSALLLISSQPVVAQPLPANVARFLDRNGGYRDKFGGYYDSKANTYTDEHGGVLDYWEGYTYKDGSYKSKLGDYWDAPTKTFKLANGEVLKSKDTPNADAVTVLRQSVEESGKVDKNFIRKAMMEQIMIEHSLPAN